MTLLERATKLATLAHRGQKRKHSGDPYIVHPLRVAALARDLGFHEDFQAVAVLHDVIEDTDESLNAIAKLDDAAGAKIAMLVMWLTNPKDDLKDRANRRLRVGWMCERVARGPEEARLIKLLDRYDNMRDLPAEDDFFSVYCRESTDLVAKVAGPIIGDCIISPLFSNTRKSQIAKAVAESILRLATRKVLGDKNTTDPAIEALFV